MEVLTYGGAPVAYALHPAETVRTLASVIMFIMTFKELFILFWDDAIGTHMKHHSKTHFMVCHNAFTK